MAKQKIRKTYNLSVKKILTLILIAAMMVNLVLLGARKINPLLFWLIIAACAIIAFKAFPGKNIKEKQGQKKS